jgi:DNA-binding NarL/FixJ family response regulator
MRKIRILLADDHAVLRAGVRALISGEPDLEVVGEVGTTHAAVEFAEAAQPDVVSLDLTMPGGSSVKAVEQIRDRCPKTKVLVLTMHDDAAYFRAVLAAGASGYVIKTASDSELLMAIRAVAEGRTFFNVPLTGDDVHSVLGDQPIGPKGSNQLSEREREVLALLAHGHTNQEAADRLLLSVKTIETYRSRIAEKLGLRSRADLVRYALEMGLMALPEEQGGSVNL